jgi:hypothetical protein
MKKWLTASLGALILGSAVARAEHGSGSWPTASTRPADTSAPSAPVVSESLHGAIVAPTPELTGTAQPGSTVMLLIDGQEVGSTQAEASGQWSYMPTRPLMDGPHEVKARATDADGHTSAESVGRTFTVILQGGEDLSVQGEGLGCTSMGSEASLVWLGLGVLVTLAGHRRTARPPQSSWPLP